MLGRPPIHGSRQHTHSQQHLSVAPHSALPRLSADTDNNSILPGDACNGAVPASCDYYDDLVTTNETAAGFGSLSAGLIPPLPRSIRDIQALVLAAANDIDAPAVTERLLSLVKRDESLTRYLMHYVRALSSEDVAAIEQIHITVHENLGFDVASYLILGVLAMDSFELSANSGLNKATLWRDALCTALLMERLAGLAHPDTGLDSATAFRCGIFHKIGMLLLADTYADPYLLISRLLDREDHVDILHLERNSLGIDHTEAGAQLMEAWGFPTELALVCRYHLDAHYFGARANYVHLCRVAKCLLTQRGLSVCRQAYRAAPAIAVLGIRVETAQAEADNIVTNMNVIDEELIMPFSA